jgi:hypothetical protein
MARALSSADTVRVSGLAQFRRELRKLDEPQFLNQLKDANNEVAERVVGWARSTAASVGRQQASAARSLRAGRQQARATVSFGGRGFEYAAGAEFGASRNQMRTLPNGRRARGWNQFRPWRGNDDGAGYFLWPAIRRNTDSIVDIYGDAIEKISRDAFPD